MTAPHADVSAQDPNYDFLPLYATQPGTGGVPGPLAGGEMCTFRCVSRRSQPDRNFVAPTVVVWMRGAGIAKETEQAQARLGDATRRGRPAWEADGGHSKHRE